MNAYGMQTHYSGPENRLPLLFAATEHSVPVRIGWIFVDAMGWPRVEVDRLFLS